MNQRSINQLHKKFAYFPRKFWPNFEKTLAKEVEFVTLPGLPVNRKKLNEHSLLLIIK